MDLLQQLEQRLAKAESLLAKIFTPTGEWNPPVINSEQEAALKNLMAGAIKEGVVKEAVLSLVPTGNGATTSPVGSVGPAAPAAPAVSTGPLLDASWLTPFDLKGRGRKVQLIDVVKGDKLTVVADVKTTNGGGVGVNLVRPDNNAGAAKYQKLEKLGKNTVYLTAEITGKVYFSVEANGSDTTILSVNLTKTV